MSGATGKDEEADWSLEENDFLYVRIKMPG